MRERGRGGEKRGVGGRQMERWMEKDGWREMDGADLSLLSTEEQVNSRSD